jgi:hypothetical protein
MSHAKRYAALAAIGVILITSVHLLQGQLDQQRAATPKLQRFMYLPQGEHLRIAVLGYHQVVADLLWIPAIQAMGERTVSEQAGHWIAHALDVITTLDPKFIRVYEAGGIALTTLVTMPEESNRLLQKGIGHNPDVWELPFLLGFNYYFELHDDRTAAEYIARASRLPRAPAYLAPFAARLYVSARDPEDAIVFLSQVYAQTTEENMKQVLERRLKEVIVERDLQLLEEAISRYRGRNKRAPERLEDLVGPGLLRELPREPFGGHYLYDPLTGTVRSSEMKERLQVLGKRRPQ